MAQGNKKTIKDVIIPIKFKGNYTELVSDVNNLKSRLNSISNSNKKLDILNIDKSSVEGAIKQVKTLEELIEKSKDFSGDINPFKWATNLKSSNLSIQDLNANLRRLGESTIQVEKLQNALGTLPQPIKKIDTALDKMGRTLINTLRYNVANKFVDSILSSSGQVIDYLETVDKSLNDIRIVTGKSNSEMEGFTVTAQKSAKVLGKVTSDYLKGSELYYQQGLATNEVLSRTEATMKASNIATQDVGTTADQVTAVLNGFNISASETISTLDKMAAVGAGTATDFEEIAKASQKVASSASEAGISLNDTLGILSTISSVTREAPEAIGTSLNALIGRYNSLKFGDEVSSGIEKAFKNANTGITVFNEETGQLKTLPETLKNLSEEWGNLSINQQKSITTAMAGTRQANRLMALLSNWDMFESYRDMAENSAGALDEQNGIYLEGLEAVKNQQKVAMEEMWSNFLDVDTIKEFYTWLTRITEKFSDITKAVGGIGPMMTNMLAMLQKPIIGMIAPAVTNKALSTSAASRFSGQSNKSESETISRAQQELKDNFNIETKILSTQERKNYLTSEANKKYSESIALFDRLLTINKELEASKGYGSIDSTVLEQTSEGTKLVPGKVDLGGIIGINQTLLDLQDDFLNSKESEKKASEQVNKTINDKLIKVRDEIKLKEKSLRLDKSMSDEERTQLKTQIEKLKLSTKELIASKATPETKESILRKASPYSSLSASEFMRMNVGTTFSGVQNKLIEREDFSEVSKLIQQRDLVNQLLKDSSTYEQVNKITTRTKSGKEIGAADLFLNQDKNMGKLKIEAEEYERVFEEMLKSLRLTIKNEVDQVEILQKEKTSTEKSDDYKNARQNISDTEMAAKSAASFDKAFKGVVIAGQAMNFLKTAMNDSISVQDKMTSATNTIGASLSMMGGTAGIVGIAISLLGPAFIEAFDIGVSQSEKLSKNLTKIVENFSAVTKATKQQKQDLAPISAIYKSLAEDYEKQAFTYNQLSEEQQSQYNQVSDYIEKYAPELIKYYDAEGKAVLDLSRGYEYLNNSFKEYQSQTYASISGATVSNFENLVKINKIAKEEQDRLLQKQQDIQQRMLDGGNATVLQKQLGKVAEEIAANNAVLASFSSNYDKLVVDPVLLANRGFADLDVSIQNTFRSLMSVDEVLSATQTTYGGYIEDLQSLMFIFSSGAEETIQKFMDMDSIIREGILKTLLYLDDTSEELSNKLATITQEDFLSGGSLLEFDSEQAINNLKREKESANALKETYEELLREKEKQNADEISKSQQNNSQGMFQSSPVFSGNTSVQAPALIDTTSIINDLTETTNKLETLNNVIINDENSLREYYKTSQDVIYGIFLDSVYNFTQASGENFNTIKAKFEELREELKNNTISEESLRLMNDYRLILNADNAEYFTAFKEQNREQSFALEQELGIRIDDYKTFSEYKLAIDDAYAKRRQLLEIAITQGTEAANRMRLQFDVERKIKALANEKQFQDASLLLQANGEEQSVLLTLYGEKDKLIEQKKSLESILEAIKAGNIAKAKAYAEDFNAFAKSEGDKAAVAAKVSGGEVKYKAESIDIDKYVNKNSQAFIESEINKIDAAIGAIDEKIVQKSEDVQKRLGSTFDSEYYNTLIGSFDTYLANFNLELDGFDEIKERQTGITDEIRDNLNSLGGSSDSKKFNLELDPLRKYIIEIEKLSNDLSILADKKEKAYGLDYVNILKEEAAINRDIFQTTEAKLIKIKELAAVRRELLQTSGVQFSEYGAISNYNEILQSTNNSAGDNAAQELKVAMDDYEKYALSKMRETEAELMKIRKELAEIVRQQVEFPIKLIVDARDDDKKLIDFLAEIQKFNGGRITFSISADATSKNLIGTFESLQSMLSSGGGFSGFRSDILFDPDIAGNKKLQLEMIEQRQQELQNIASSMMQLSDQMAKAFGEALGEAISLIDGEVSKFLDISNQYEYLISLAKKLNKDDSSIVEDSYNKLSDIFRNNISSYISLADIIKESRDSFKVGSEDWITANNKYLEVQGKVIEQEKKLAEILGQKYDTSVSSGRSDLEKILFGGMTADEAQSELDKMNKLREKYLDTETRIAKVSNLENSIQQDISKLSSNPKTQEQLRKFMNSEIKFLNEKKDLTQTDLDITQKQYSILKARIELEEAYNNKQYQMILQRNENGTFGYMYVQNTEGIDEAQQKYKDSIDDLYQYSIDKNKQLQQESIDIRKNTLSEYDKILKKLKDGTITEEEAVSQLGDSFKQMTDDLKKNAEEQAKMQQQIASTKIMQLLGVNGEEFDGISSVEDSLKNVFDILANSGEVSGVPDILSGLDLDAESLSGSIGEQIQQAYSLLGGNEDALKILMDAFTKSGDSTAATILALLRENGDINELTKEIFENNLSSSGDKFNELLDKISSGTIKPEDLFTDNLIGGITDVGDIWDKVSGAIDLDLEQLLKDFNISDPSSALGIVAGNIISAFEEYQEALSDAYDRVTADNEELADMTEILNDRMKENLSLLEKEMEEVVELTKQYNKMRKEIAEALKEVAEYMKELIALKEEIMKPAPSRPSWDGSFDNDFDFGNGVQVGGGTIVGDATQGWNPDNIMDFINGQKPKPKAKFHTGGVVGVNEGQAIVKKNERILTEEQADISDRIYKSLKNISDLNSNLDKGLKSITNMTNNNQKELIQNINLQVEFPNVTRESEIVAAIETLKQNAQQHINKE